MILIRKNNEYYKMTIKQVFFRGGGEPTKNKFKNKKYKISKTFRLHQFIE